MTLALRVRDLEGRRYGKAGLRLVTLSETANDTNRTNFVGLVRPNGAVVVALPHNGREPLPARWA